MGQWIVERFEDGRWVEKPGVYEDTYPAALAQAARVLSVANDQLYKLRVRPFGAAESWRSPGENG